MSNQNNEARCVVRNIEAERSFSARRFFLQWEWLLVIVLILINVFNSAMSANYLSTSNLLSAIQMFLDKAILVFPMMLILLLGEIDISVGSTMALSSVLMGIAFRAGVPMWCAVLISLATGAVCGFINGVIVAKFKELSSMIVTLSTMIIYRGIASILLENGAVGGFDSWFSYLGWGNVGPIPFILLFFIIEAIYFTYLVHKTKFGRNVYAMGNNETTSRFSGVAVDRMKIIIFTTAGVFASVAGMFLASKMGSVRPSMALNYELDIIAMAVLGGVSTAGGKGNVAGTIISIFIIGLLRYGLGIINVPSQTILIIVGLLLVIAVAIPNLNVNLKGYRLFKAKNK